MRIRTMLMVLSLLSVGAGDLLAQDVRYNFDKGANFSTYRTYKWVALKEGRVANELAEMQIKAAIDSELALKGLTRVEGDTADLFVGYQAAVNTEKQYTSFDSGYGYGPGWGGGWYGGGGMSTTTGTTSTIYIGQLAVDMYASAAKSLVWRGVVSKTIDTKAKPDKQQKNLNKAMAKLFKNFPPPPAKSS